MSFAAKYAHLLALKYAVLGKVTEVDWDKWDEYLLPILLHHLEPAFHKAFMDYRFRLRRVEMLKNKPPLKPSARKCKPKHK